MFREPTAEEDERLRERWRLIGAALLYGLTMAGSAFCGVLPEHFAAAPRESETEEVE